MKKLLSDEILRYSSAKKNFALGIKLFSRRPNLIAVLPGNYGWRLTILGLLVFIVVLTFVTKAVWLQIINYDKYTQLARMNKTRTALILPERGVIYSSDGHVLARNKPSFAIELNKSLCAEVCSSIVAKLREYIKLDDTRVAEELASAKAVALLATHLSKEDALRVEASLYQLPGISVIVYPQRDYLYPEVFAHSIGYVGLDEQALEPRIVGKTGIEQAYNSYLEGIPGKKLSEVDSFGKKYTVVAEENSFPGTDVKLFIHRDLSVKAFDLLKKIVDEKKATAGVVVAQDPRTGGVLALVSYPSFDSGKLSEGISFADYKNLIENPAKPFFNRAIAGAYPPGSTFKMVTASAGLSEGVITKNTTIFDPGYLSVNGFRFNNWKLDGHGDVNLVRALQISNDTYFYTVGGGYGGVSGVGIEKLALWAQRFGLGKPTALDIAGEVNGYIPDGKSRQWYLGDTYITAIGQGDVLATPLQMNGVTNYFANGGYLVKPKLVHSVVGVEESEVDIVARGFVSSANYAVIKEGLNKAVLPGGTAYPLFDFPQKHNGIQLGGKTGTSEFTGPDGKPATHAWFTAFGPLDNATISLTVFLEGGGAGSDDAAPIARQLLDLWFAK